MPSYRKHHIKNRIHRIKPRRSVFLRLWFWILILILTIFLSFAYFLLFYSEFQIQNVLISGNEKVKTFELQSIISNNINRKIIGLGAFQIFSKSIFLLNKDALSKDILKDFPLIDRVSIKTELPQTLTVEVSERAPVGIYCSPEAGQISEKCFLIDGAGIIFEELKNNPENMFIVRQMGNKEAYTGENVIAQNIIGAVSKIEKDLKDNFKIDIKEALITTPIRLDIKTKENWQIYFDLSKDSDVNMQITKLNLLLKGDINADVREKLQYIDLRFKDRAYYK